MRTTSLLFLTISSVCLLASCAAPEPAASDYNTVGTIKDIMDSAIDPAADFIWESFTTEVSADGIVEKRPQNDEEWKEVRRKAVILVEAANLLMMPERRVAKPGDKSENPEIELSPEEIEALISKDRDTFIQLAKDFQQNAIAQLKAADQRNVEEMLQLGGELDVKCENCHRKYWYPNDPGFQEPAQLPSATDSTGTENK
jgi:hypothetical protein